MSFRSRFPIDRFFSGLCALALSSLAVHAADVGGNLVPGDFENGFPTYNPWAGVDDLGYLTVPTGGQLSTGDDGRVTFNDFSPSVAFGDLNGDGLPDLVVADSRGYFWFFPNSGKKGAPVFTHGEVLPIWLGIYEIDKWLVPRIQLIDLDGDGKLDIVAGNFQGQFFYLHNSGSATQPNFVQADDVDTMSFPTHSGGLLWCNYFSPFMYDFSHTGRLDMIMGEGTYSANSIYYFTNQGTSQRPIFNEDHRTKIIPGFGREHLTPQVVDWNNDGKPDIIAGDRTGYVNVWLNNASSAIGPPSFDPGPQGNYPATHVSFGGTELVGDFPTVCVADLNDDKNFDLIVCTATGQLQYAINTGTPGKPVFGALKPFLGKNQYPKIQTSDVWEISPCRPYGAPYEVLEVVNATTEQGFTPPPDFKGKSALKFWILDPKNVYFKKTYYPAEQVPNHEIPIGDFATNRSIHYKPNKIEGVKLGERYKVSLWVKTDGDVTGFKANFVGVMGRSPDEFTVDLNTSGSWTKVTGILRVDSQKTPTPGPGQPAVTGDMEFQLEWKGDGSVYVDDIQLIKQS